MTVTIPLWLIQGVVLFVSGLIVYFVGYSHGYKTGVDDTEHRWDDAVLRREDALRDEEYRRAPVSQ